ncbi:hypothetical protein [Streptomyces sp. LN549]|uniref:hypothetical protein n=1 Tax=Streptomyces sp. LN549 TaxID=3112979 RepID=UPI003719FAD8
MNAPPHVRLRIRTVTARPGRTLPAPGSQLLHPEEREGLLRIPPARAHRRLARLRTRKEACLTGLGTGLGKGLGTGLARGTATDCLLESR